MGLASGSQPLPFGHSADAAVDIEGLSVRPRPVFHSRKHTHEGISSLKIICKSYVMKKALFSATKRRMKVLGTVGA